MNEWMVCLCGDFSHPSNQSIATKNIKRFGRQFVSLSTKSCVGAISAYPQHFLGFSHIKSINYSQFLPAEFRFREINRLTLEMDI